MTSDKNVVLLEESAGNERKRLRALRTKRGWLEGRWLACSARVLTVQLLAMLFVVPAMAGPGDLPDPPNAQTRVPQSSTSTDQSIVASGTARSPHLGVQLVRGTIVETIIVGDEKKTVSEWLDEIAVADPNGLPLTPAQIARNDNIKNALMETLETDLAIVEQELDIDKATRQETSRLDQKYARLQAALHNLKDNNTNVASAGSMVEVQSLFQEALADDTNAKRLQFIAPSMPEAGHFVGGDLFIDPENKVASLVIWDTILLNASFVPKWLENELPNGYTSVVTHIPTDIQQLTTGCRQCALQFMEDMATRDVHSEQLAEVTNKRLGGFREKSFIIERDVLSLDRNDGEQFAAQSTLRLTNSKTALRTAIQEASLRNFEALNGEEITFQEFQKRQQELKAIESGVEPDRREREIFDAAGKSAGTTKSNLLLDRLRRDDLRAIAERLSEAGPAQQILEESNAQFERVVERSGAAGIAQAARVDAMQDSLNEIRQRTDLRVVRTTSTTADLQNRTAALEVNETFDIPTQNFSDADFPTPPAGVDRDQSVLSDPDDEEQSGEEGTPGYADLQKRAADSQDNETDRDDDFEQIDSEDLPNVDETEDPSALLASERFRGLSNF